MISVSRDEADDLPRQAPQTYEVDDDFGANPPPPGDFDRFVDAVKKAGIDGRPAQPPKGRRA